MFKKNKVPYKLSILTAACLLAHTTAYAQPLTTYLGRSRQARGDWNLQTIPLDGRAYVDATLGSQGFLYGDAMLPVLGNQEGFIFLDTTEKWGTDHGWLGSLGLGLRDIWRGAIFGGYLFGEYDRTTFGNNYWMLHPGVELISPHWDLHVNGYFPLGDRQHVNAVFFGSQLGITCPTFKGRQQFDQVYNHINEVAPGMDAEIGYTLPHNRIRVFGGGYYYFFNQAPELHGVETGVEVPLNQTFSLMFRDSYDNTHRNTAVFSLRVYLGGMNHIDEYDIHERLLDPIRQHVGVLYTGSGIPSEQVIYDTGQRALMRDNIWFFRAGTARGNTAIGSESCTYEQPCRSNQFNQINVNNINGIAPNANFYLAGNANYSISAMTLNAGQSIYGRTIDFCRVASSNLPQLFGNLTLLGNNTLQAFSLINHLVPRNHPTAGVGITMRGATGIVIDRVSVGSPIIMDPFVPVPRASFRTGILMEASSATITSSTINTANITANATSLARGIVARNNSNLIFQRNNINVHSMVSSSSPNTFFLQGLGVDIYNSKAVLQNNNIAVIGDETLFSSGTLDSFNGRNPMGAIRVGSNLGGESNVMSAKNQISMTTVAQQFMGANGTLDIGGFVNFIYSNGSGSQTRFTSDGDTSIFNASTTNTTNNANDEIVQYGTEVNAQHGGTVVSSTQNNQITLNANMASSSNVGTEEKRIFQADISGLANDAARVQINSMGDTFVNRARIVTNGGEAIIRQYGIYGSTTNNATLVINAKGDVFNKQGFIYSNTSASTRATGALASNAQINLSGNRFIFRERQNGSPAPVFYKRTLNGGVINDDGTNVFLNY